MGDIYAHVGRQVRARRLSLEMTIEELAESAGFHPSYVGQIERGLKKASLATVVALAQALDIRVSVLCDRAAERLEAEDRAVARLTALLRSRRAGEKQVLLSTLRHLARELRELRARER